MLANFWSTYYEKLGFVGIPLAFAAILAVFLTIKIYTQLGLVEFQFRRFFDRVESGEPQLLSDDRICRTNPLACIVRDIALKHRHHSDDLRSEAAYLFHKYFYKTKRNFATLRLITATSPMLGLLGTVLGIIQVFDVIGNGGNTSGPGNTQLALGIGQALWTTVLGICIAVPTLAVLYYLKHKLLGYMLLAVEFSYRAAAISKKAEAGESADTETSHA